MTAFTLVIQPNGAALLTTPEPLSRDMVAAVREAFDAWQQKHGDVLVVGDCDVVQVRSIELDIAVAEPQP